MSKIGMNIVRGCVAAALLTLCAMDARAQFVTNDKTLLTFSGPVELPGLNLQAGTYTFRLADTPSRNVVQVLTQDEKKILGQFLFAHAERADITKDTVITFKETAANTTPAIRYWYYSGTKSGREFIYPKEQATRIAARTHTSVLTAEGTAGNASVSSIDEFGKVTPVNPDTSASTSQSARVDSAPRTDAPASAAADYARSAQASNVDTYANDRTNATPKQRATNELPQTASPLPLAGLMGLFFLAGGLALRATRS